MNNTILEKAKRPFILVGGGAVSSGASAEVMEFATKIDAPVCDTLMGKGGFDGKHPLYTGMIGMHGTKASNTAINKADLVVVLGARFSDRVISDPKKFPVNTKFVHIDIDSAVATADIGLLVNLTHSALFPLVAFSFSLFLHFLFDAFLFVPDFVRSTYVL